MPSAFQSSWATPLSAFDLWDSAATKPRRISTQGRSCSNWSSCFRAFILGRSVTHAESSWKSWTRERLKRRSWTKPGRLKEQGSGLQTRPWGPLGSREYIAQQLEGVTSHLLTCTSCGPTLSFRTQALHFIPFSDPIFGLFPLPFPVFKSH